MFTTHDNFSRLKLVTGSQGAKDYWDYVMATMDKTPLCQLNIGMDMPDVFGGYYTRLEGGLLDSINLPAHTATVNGDEVSFESDKAYVIFMHESSHFLHLVVDKGCATAPSLEGRIYTITGDDARDLDARRDVEFEAGYRSLFRNMIHNVFDDPRLITELNLINLFSYDKYNLTGEQADKIIEAVNKIDDDEERHNWIKDHIVKHVKSYMDWADPNHEITWIE